MAGRTSRFSRIHGQKEERRENDNVKEGICRCHDLGKWSSISLQERRAKDEIPTDDGQ